MTRRLGVTVFSGVAVLALAGCSGSGDSGVADTETGPTRPVPQTLPGESELQAIERIIFPCYEEFGIIVGPKQPDGGYMMDSPSYEIGVEAAEVCNQRLVDAGLQGDYPLTEQEIRDNYDRIEQYRQCLIDQGHSLPPMISYDEFAASAGVADIFNGVSQVFDGLSKPQADALHIACPQG